MLMIRIAAAAVFIDLMMVAAAPVSAQNFPARPIRIITTEPGSGNDLQARLIAQGIAGPLGQPVIVENRSGVLSAEYVAKALPDGYTMTLQGSVIWLAPLLQSNIPWDALRDFAPITLSEKSPNILCVHPSVTARTVKDLIAQAKAKPGTLSYSSGPVGGSSHLAGELFKAMAGVNILHVPYKGGGPAAVGAAAGEVSMTFNGGGSVTPHIKTGKLIPIAVTGSEPYPHFPELPTIAATVPGYSQESWTVILAPAKTPTAVVHRLNQEIVRVLNQPEVKDKLFASGVQVVANSPEQLAAGIKSEVAKWGKLIKEHGFKQAN